MDSEKRKVLETAGWRFGDAADFLGMTDEERQLLDARVEAALAVRRQREALKLSQKQLANRIKTSQPRVAKIERAAPDVSLDQILRAFAAAGGRIAVKQVDRSRTTKVARRPARVSSKRAETVLEAPIAYVQIQLIRTEL
jgi:transcriptional regulator with XRE-family HTH domain